MERRIRHAGGVLSVCGDEWLLAEWWISTEEIEAIRDSEGVSFVGAVELLQASGCPICSDEMSSIRNAAESRKEAVN